MNTEALIQAANEWMDSTKNPDERDVDLDKALRECGLLSDSEAITEIDWPGDDHLIIVLESNIQVHVPVFPLE